MTNNIEGNEVKPENTSPEAGDSENTSKEVEASKSVEKDWEKMYNDQKIRAEKAEKALKDKSAGDATPKTDSSKETKEEPQTEEFGLLHRTFLGQHDIKEDDEVERAKELQEETGLSWEKLVTSNYFKSEMQAFKDSNANAKAVDVDAGGGGDVSAKENVEYWAKKGTLPTHKDVPDRSKRDAIVTQLLQREKNQGGTYYNE